MSAIFTFCKVSCNFDWDSSESVSEYSFGSLEGAREWIDGKKDSLTWYSISVLTAYPCKEDNPCGQLYYGMNYHEFKELKNT